MKSWTIILSFTLFPFSGGACGFKSNMAKVYSLSGPLTMAMKEVGLFKDSKLKGISIFHPISEHEFKGAFLPGGIFLSREVADEMKGSMVFFDEGRELSKMLRTMKLTNVEVSTRGLVPLEVVDLMGKLLLKYTEGCEKNVAIYQEKSKKLAREVLQSVPKKLSAVFFLGKIRRGRPPETAMVNDGIVKWLRKEKKITTYPSELAYVSWSAKVMNSLPPNTLKIGVTDTANTLARGLGKLSVHEINFSYPGSLIPGITQLEAWLYLLREIGP